MYNVETRVKSNSYVATHSLNHINYFVHWTVVEVYLIENTLSVKKGAQELKQALLKKIWNQMGSQWFLVLIGLKVLVMMNSLQKHCYFRCLRPPDIDGIKFFDKDDQAAKRCFYLNVFQPGHLYQKFWSHQHQEVLSTWNNNVLAVSSSWPKLSTLSKPRGIGCPFDFTSFSTRPVLVLGHSFFIAMFMFMLHVVQVPCCVLHEMSHVLASNN